MISAIRASITNVAHLSPRQKLEMAGAAAGTALMEESARRYFDGVNSIGNGFVFSTGAAIVLIAATSHLLASKKAKEEISVTTVAPVVRGESLKESRKKMYQMEELINKQLTCPKKIQGLVWDQVAIGKAAAPYIERWKEPKFMQEVTYFMENGAIEIENFYTELEKAAHSDPEKMASLMERQRRELEQLGDPEDPLSCYIFFFASVTSLYHVARDCRAFVDFKDSLRGFRKEKLEDEDQDPYFTEGTPQFRWREIYNDFCAKIDHYKLRAHLTKKDIRFIHWSTPDTGKVKGFFTKNASRPT